MSWKKTWTTLMGEKSTPTPHGHMDKMAKSPLDPPAPPSSGHIDHLAIGDEVSILSTYREGPPYPDGLGRVKCIYCSHLVGLTCTHTGEITDGISLLRQCDHFMRKE